MSNPIELQTITVTGPFWSAEVEVAELGAPERNFALRALFLDRTPRKVGGATNVLAPGTLIVLGVPRRLEVRTGSASSALFRWERPAKLLAPNLTTPAAVSDALAQGQACLLLLVADPTAWSDRAKSRPPAFTCLAGEIPLERAGMAGQSNAARRLYQGLNLGQIPPANLAEREGPARLVSVLTAHASGLSLAGQATLPWLSRATDGNRPLANGVFQLTRVRTAPEETALRFRLTVELERLSTTEERALADAWEQLSARLNPPHPLNRRPANPSGAPRWATLEITAPRRAPRLSWLIESWQPTPTSLPISVERGEMVLVLSDHQPYDIERPPSSLARFVPEPVLRLIPGTGQAPETLVISFGTNAVGETNLLSYTAATTAEGWREQLQVQGHELTYDPGITAQLLRDTLALPPPEQAAGEASSIEPPLLWGALPLADGWAQLPVANLSEQLYLDAGLVGVIEPPRSATIQGAVTFGNVDGTNPAPFPTEQPWSLTLVDAQGIAGAWTLPSVNGDFSLAAIQLTLASPELVASGLLWLSTSAPSVADALPDFDNWVAGLQSVPLRSVKIERSNEKRYARDLFPAPFTFQLPQLTLSPAPVNTPGAARLNDWALVYQANSALIVLKDGAEREVFAALFDGRLLTANALAVQPVPVWRRHPALPMVQALPLTQSKLPPNTPSASRQLLPSALPVARLAGGPARPDGWRFGVPPAEPGSAAPGAADWPQLLSPTRPPGEWWSFADLPLAALSVPGLDVDQAQADGLVPVASGWPGGGYRFDLPYTDEVHALAELPKTPRNPREVSPLPNEPPPTPPQPLDPTTYADHWRRLAELASLARGDATDALARTPDGAVVRHLVEPFDWPVRVVAELGSYPGSLAFAEPTDATAPESVAPEAQLRSITGEFWLQNGTLVRTPQVGIAPFLVEAGSMAAYREPGGSVRDQRGLSRSAAARWGELIAVEVTLQEAPHAAAPRYALTSTLLPWQLAVGEGSGWQLWFRDLPLRSDEGAGPTLSGTFDWQRSRSERNQDINDPEAASRTHNHLSGYEWRLAEAEATGAPYLQLCGLHFYPLRLAGLTVTSNQVTDVVIQGRLQLPLSGAAELEDLGNVVALTFRAEGAGPPTLKAVALVAEGGEWPLAVDKGELTAAPRLRWSSISLDGTRLVLSKPSLDFELFGVPWAVELDALMFSAAQPLIELVKEFAAPTTPTWLAPARIELALNLAAHSLPPTEVGHTAAIVLALRLGRAGDAAMPTVFSAEVKLPIFSDKLVWLQAALFEDLVVSTEQRERSTAFQWAGRSFHFVWERCEFTTAGGLQLLPGMYLAASELPGYATVSFNAVAVKDSIPMLELASASVEAVLQARWGRFLHDALPDAALQPEAIARSSVGDLSCGYSGHWRAATQSESLMLNGFLEVANLISWPLGITYDAATGKVELPPARGAGEAGGHTRHTMRVLLNQLGVDDDVVAPAPGAVLFQLLPGKTWRFLAVVEHQFLELTPTVGDYVRGGERRWSVVQELRVTHPADLRRDLDLFGQALAVDPVRGIAPIGEHGRGLFQPETRALLGLALDRLAVEAPDTLIVEASAAHWVNTAPAAPARPTALQFLPGGSQHGILSDLDDFGPSDPTDPAWLLITVPFFGRLQAQERDRATEGAEARRGASPLEVEPLLVVAAEGAGGTGINPLALQLANRGATVAIGLFVAALDTDAGRRWPRLDPTSLEENWFRLQTPPVEPRPALLPSIVAALPDTPARLSRTTSLRASFDVFRPSYPPAQHQNGLPAQVDGSPLVWRPESVLIDQQVTATRGTAGLLALYTFRETSGAVVHDVSGVNPALNLKITPASAVRWVADGMEVHRPAVIVSGRALKLLNGFKASGAISIEAWVRPAQAVLQPLKPGRIVTLSKTFELRNVTLQQGDFRREESTYYHARLRTVQSDLEGEPPFPTAQGSLTTEMTHVVFTRDPAGAVRIYLNGVEQASGTRPGSFDNWEMNAVLSFANEPDNQRPWLGTFRLVALYARALSADEVRQHYGASVAEAPWATTGMLLTTFDTPPASGARHAAATLLPARLQVPDGRPGQAGKSRPNPTPLTFAVSPYLGLEYRPVPAESNATLSLLVAELVAIAPADGVLRALATRTWDGGSGNDEAVKTWAREVHALVAPASPVALLRLREIWRTGAAELREAVVRTLYRFALVDKLQRPADLTRRLARLRAPIDRLRFREGQFGGTLLPAAARPFEVAAPQVIGAQPIYLTGRPDERRPWPWGLSALRLSLRYTHGDTGVAGPALSADAGAATNGSTSDARLWWQTISRRVQFRSSLSDNRPAAGLPASFRARAIVGLLPAPPRPALPMLGAGLKPQGDNAPGAPVLPWQPVLPGAMRYVLAGARPGVMLAMRHHLLSQPLGGGEALLSGGVPVQHRSPRPVPLPATLASGHPEETALQPWASRFAPTALLHASPDPLDETFFAAVRALPDGTGGVPARGLRLRLLQPQRGRLTAVWARKRPGTDASQRPEQSGELLVQVEPLGEGTAIHWRVEFALVDGPLTIAYEPFEVTGAELPRSVPLAAAASLAAIALERATRPGDAALQAQAAAAQRELDAAHERLQQLLARKAAGSVLTLHARVQDMVAGAGLTQTLRFALRVGGGSALPLPLEPFAIHFEDPEYNRRLVSQTARAAQLVRVLEGGLKSSRQVALASDRREYNPDSTVALRFDWDDNRKLGEPVRHPLNGARRVGDNQELTLGGQGIAGLIAGDVLLITADGLPGVLAEVVSANGNRVEVTTSQTLPRTGTVSYGGAYVVLRRIDPDGIATALAAYSVEAGQLFQAELAEVQRLSGSVLQPGYQLEIRLLVREQLIPPEQVRSYRPIVIRVTIIANPVLPTPEAAYALLRSEGSPEAPKVACVRFAWAPEASRIELVSADDLRGELVRRRAVFQWRDSARPGRGVGYALQKLARNGATAVPELGRFISPETP